MSSLEPEVMSPVAQGTGLDDHTPPSSPQGDLDTGTSRVLFHSLPPRTLRPLSPESPIASSRCQSPNGPVPSAGARSVLESVSNNHPGLNSPVPRIGPVGLPDPQLEEPFPPLDIRDIAHAYEDDAAALKEFEQGWSILPNTPLL